MHENCVSVVKNVIYYLAAVLDSGESNPEVSSLVAEVVGLHRLVDRVARSRINGQGQYC